MQQDHIDRESAYLRASDALKVLRPKIEALQNAADVAYGPHNGIIPLYFSDYTVDEEEGATYSIDRAWTRAFQKCSNRLDLITRGKHGVAAIYNFFKEFKKSPQMTVSDFNFLELKIQDLIRLVEQRSALHLLFTEFHQF